MSVGGVTDRCNVWVWGELQTEEYKFLGSYCSVFKEETLKSKGKVKLYVKEITMNL